LESLSSFVRYFENWSSRSLPRICCSSLLCFSFLSFLFSNMFYHWHRIRFWICSILDMIDDTIRINYVQKTHNMILNHECGLLNFKCCQWIIVSKEIFLFFFPVGQKCWIWCSDKINMISEGKRNLTHKFSIICMVQLQHHSFD